MRHHSPSRRWATTLGATALLAVLGAPAALASGADCDPLVSHAPTGSQGDTAAVAITSQTLAAGVDGWERVGWQAAPDTTVTAVELVREDGTEHRTDGDLADGTAEHVLEVRFCGTTDGAEAETTEEAAVVQVTASAEEPATPDEAPDEDHAELAPTADEPQPTTAPTDTDTTDDADPSSEADGTDAADEVEAESSPTRSGAEHESDGPQRAERGDDTGTGEPDVAQATLAAAIQEPTAPLTGGVVGLLAGLFVIAGAQRRRTRQERA